MGIARGTFKLLLEEKKKGHLHGKILQLGRQHIFLTYSQIKKIAKNYLISLKDHPISLSWQPELKKEGCIDDITLFKMLGFDAVDSLDCSSYENATYQHDLNTPIGTELQEQYDVIFDGGTLEHIFHFPMCLSNIHQMLKNEGIVIHASPSHNYVDHGFYLFSPTLFYDYYTANGYAIVSAKIIKQQKEHYDGLWKAYDYQPGCIDHLSFGGFGGELLSTWFVAKKTKKSTCKNIPMQGQYVSIWKKGTDILPPIRFAKCKKLIKKNKHLYIFLKKIKRWLFPKKMPPGHRY